MRPSPDLSRSRVPTCLPGPPPGQARTLDKFYTHPAVARQCIRDFQAWTDIDLQANLHDIVEPSAGAGAFLDALPTHARGFDIAPDDSRITQADFLSLHLTAPAVVIGNPPFGKAARLAVRFFNHAAGFASHIAFILPRTFEKASIRNRLDRRFHLLGERVLTPESFVFEGSVYRVPCTFQVWERRRMLRPLDRVQRTHPDFSFVPRDQADFALQRVGARAGAIKTDMDHIAAASHHFIKAQGSAARLIERLRAIDFTPVKQRTAGNPSISKAELIEMYAQAIENLPGSCR